MLDALTAIENRYDEIERLLADPSVLTDHIRIQSLAKEHASLKHVANLAQMYRRVVQDLDDARTMSRDGSDRELAMLAREEQVRLEGRMKEIEAQLRIALLPKDPNDGKNVIMEIRAAAGGEEAGLFAAVLFRMYSRYSQRNGWGIEVINSNETGLGSIKEIVFQIKGDGAYSRLKHESGAHRVQRIPVTESSGRIHTSMATVAVLPEAEEIDVDLNSDDLQIDIFHSSGHGGQNVQKVATAVRITHIPTGIMAVCQDERSQFKNKSKAMAVLRSRILDLERRRQQEEETEARRSQVGTGDRSERVRTYNYPQTRVTDHRAALTLHNLEAVLDGDIGEFIDALIAIDQARIIQRAGL